MFLNRYSLRNFRRLEDVEIRLEKEDTIYVGANNSGKTSATAAFKLFVSQQSEMRIFDFSSSLISILDSFGDSEFQKDIDYLNTLPAIELDLWFTVTSSIYGQIAHLLPSITSEYSEIGVRIRFAINEPEELHIAYRSVYPLASNEKEKTSHKLLSFFLSQGSNLKRHFGFQYYSLEQVSQPTGKNEILIHPIESTIGKKTIDSLIHVDYVEAQRNIDDSNSGRSNRLSSVFANYYKKNLEKQEFDNESVRVIDKSNENLTQHYAIQFLPLINVIRSLGFPSLNDRELRLISNLNPQQALSGNTELTYVDNETDHKLPEAYNGLGYKNLIYIAIQIASFHIQWIETRINRSLCQLVFVEEPEVHLHAQVQQTFIRQIRKAMKEIEDLSGETDYVQQLIITTHSSHILAEADFQSIRYFRRIKSKYSTRTTALTSSEVISLANFNVADKEQKNLEFLKRYIKLTHCDLFFADAAILVEGTVERLLMPLMIKKEAGQLESVYLTTLELSGAFAYRFIELLEFINLPTLIITDLDSVNPNEKNSICRADRSEAKTANASIKNLTKKTLISDLLSLSEHDKTNIKGDFSSFIAFQKPVKVSLYGDGNEMIPRTFEEAFIYENIQKIRDKKINGFIELPQDLNFERDYECIYETVKSKNYKKVEFALAQLESEEDWTTPTYISEGLQWLWKTLS